MRFWSPNITCSSGGSKSNWRLSYNTTESISGALKFRPGALTTPTGAPRRMMSACSVSDTT